MALALSHYQNVALIDGTLFCAILGVSLSHGTKRENRQNNPVVANVTQSSALLALLDEPVWFCLKAQPKREHMAAIALRHQFRIECFSPRLRFRKMTHRGPVWFVEAMFPGYLFTKVVYSNSRHQHQQNH